MTDYIVKPAAEFQQLNYLRRHIAGTGGFIAGGAFKNIFEHQPVKDIDVFFPDQQSWHAACKKLKAAKYKRIYKNARVRAYIDPITGIRVELIGCPELTEGGFANDAVEYGSPLDTIQRFDFTVTKFALHYETKTVDGEDETEWFVTYHPEFFEHLQQKRLVIDAGLVKPFSTFERALRYTSYGYRLCRESKLKIVTEMQEFGFEDEAQLSASFYDGMD